MNNYPKPLTKDGMKKISNQMDNLIYKIEEKGENFNLGFFCYIKYQNKDIPVLIINNNGSILEEYKGFVILSNDDKSKKRIELGEIRYHDKEQKLTIVEVKLDKNENINFIEIDDMIYSYESEMYYYKETIYTIQNSKDFKNTYVSFGIINTINDTKLKYFGKINTELSGFPIFNLVTNKLIGIHEYHADNYNQGKFLKFAINKFIDEYKYIKKRKAKNKIIENLENEINILINVDKKDIKNEIYFIDNYEKREEKGKINKYSNLNVFNENNTVLYIDEIKSDFKKYFVPIKKGMYKIRLRFNTKLTDCSYMFAECSNIICIDFINFNTKFVKSMKGMFYNCKNLSKINLFCFDTSNVIDMSDMFSYCTYLVDLNLISFNTQNVVNASYMFYNCHNLMNLYLPLFNKQKISNTSFMFYKCTKLKNIDIFSYNNKNIETINKYENEIRILVKVNNEDNWKRYIFFG